MGRRLSVRNYLAGDINYLAVAYGVDGGRPLSHPCKTVLWDGKIIAVGGVADMGDGRAMAWSHVGDIPKSAARSVLSFAYRFLREAADNPAVLRLDALANPARIETVRTLEFLGFEIEGRLVRFYKGEDRVIAVFQGRVAGGL
jgi:hypothetical protein